MVEVPHLGSEIRDLRSETPDLGSESWYLDTLIYPFLVPFEGVLLDLGGPF